MPAERPDALQELLQRVVAEARASGRNLVITLTPDDAQAVKLFCPGCGAVLARQVRGMGMAEHRCPNRACGRQAAGARATHFFLTTGKS